MAHIRSVGLCDGLDRVVCLSVCLLFRPFSRHGSIWNPFGRGGLRAGIRSRAGIENWSYGRDRDLGVGVMDSG